MSPATGKLMYLTESQIQKEQYSFHPDHRTVDPIGGWSSWEVDSPVYMCLVDLKKAYDGVLQGILWEVLPEFWG